MGIAYFPRVSLKFAMMWKHQSGAVTFHACQILFTLYTLGHCLAYYVSQFTVERCCFADGLCLFKQPQSVLYHWNQHDEEISKKCRSVCLSVCNANKKKPTPPLLTVKE